MPAGFRSSYNWTWGSYRQKQRNENRSTAEDCLHNRSYRFGVHVRLRRETHPLPRVVVLTSWDQTKPFETVRWIVPLNLDHRAEAPVLNEIVQRIKSRFRSRFGDIVGALYPIVAKCASRAPELSGNGPEEPTTHLAPTSLNRRKAARPNPTNGSWWICSSPTYKESTKPGSQNPTNGSWWIVQVQPTKKALNQACKIPPTAVGGLFKSNLF